MMVPAYKRLKSLLHATRDNNCEHWLTTSDIYALLRLYYHLENCVVGPPEASLRREIEEFRNQDQMTLKPIVFNLSETHWTCLVLEKSAGGCIFEFLRNFLRGQTYKVFDVHTKQQYKGDNCGIRVVLNVRDMRQVLQNQRPENRMTAGVWGQVAVTTMKKAMHQHKLAELNDLRRIYSIVPRLISPPVEPAVAASPALSLKQRPLAKNQSTADVEVVVVEPESPPTPATKKLESIPKSRRTWTLGSKSLKKVLIPKQYRAEEELLYESEDDEPITIRTGAMRRIICSSSPEEESEKLEENSTFRIVNCPRDLLKGDIDIDSVIAVTEELLDLATHEDLTLNQEYNYTMPENKKMTAELSKICKEVCVWVEFPLCCFSKGQTIFTILGINRDFRSLKHAGLFKRSFREAVMMLDNIRLSFKKSSDAEVHMRHLG
uniref:Ubiquitin-like protease family profile domain-containing protein n=1 Tax=Trichogramma kaykai TaxID=54128 RepID=A0ABD2WUR8_9HYME